MATNVVLSKNSISVTVETVEVNDSYNNQLFIIKPIQSKANQSNGPKTPKIVDLLRVAHSMIIRGHITSSASKSAIAVKQDLVNIWKGAGADGGTVSLTYDSNASSIGDTTATATNPISGFIEKINFKDVSMDEPGDFTSSSENYTGVAKYEVTITFLEGTNI